jgi:cephalosporin hydroxylase
MKLTIDTDKKVLLCEEEGTSRTIELYSKESFELISRQWLRVGWAEKYPYTFTWLGRPIIQIPEDIIRIQEVIYRVRPDVIVETGIAHGGSLVFSASLCALMGKGRVIGVDIEIRPHNRAAIERHEISHLITMIEGSSVDPVVVREIRELVRPGEAVVVVLDSCHEKQHVRAELEAYCGLVSPGSYIVATDGSMKDLHDVPRGKPDWKWDNPASAAIEFVDAHSEFSIEEPAWPFNESDLTERVTHWPCAFLRRRDDR